MWHSKQKKIVSLPSPLYLYLELSRLNLYRLSRIHFRIQCPIWNPINCVRKKRIESESIRNLLSVKIGRAKSRNVFNFSQFQKWISIFVGIAPRFLHKQKTTIKCNSLRQSIAIKQYSFIVPFAVLDAIHMVSIREKNQNSRKTCISKHMFSHSIET